MTALKSREEILAALKWSEPRQVPTKRGDKIVRSAEINDEVSSLYAREKDEMYRLGYSVTQYRGIWQISEWRDVPAEVKAAKAEAIAASRATDSNVEIPCPEGLAYLGYQKAGIAFGMAKPAALIGDEMGLGKTIQAIGILNLMPTARRVLVVCPASLKLNWRRELLKWSVVEREVTVADSTFCPDRDGVTIINYDVLHKHEKFLRSVDWDLIVCDEAHYLKEPNSRRTQMVFGRAEKKARAATAKSKAKDAVPALEPLKAKRRILLTGTPIANRPVELFPLISFLDPAAFPLKGFFKYAMRYCGAHNNGFGWDFSGSSNLDELQDRLRSTIMVRRLKKDVLTELPPKRRQVIEFPSEGKLARFAEDEREAYEEREDEIADLHAAVELAKASDNPDEYVRAVENLRKGIAAIFSAISAMRRELAEAKTELCIEHIREAVSESGKVVVFAHHKTVCSAIAKAFGAEAVSLVGDTKMADRQAAVDRFQNDSSCKVFVGSIGAAGVGITLTAASHVIFCELSWVPGEVSQGEDRCHRIGQKGSVLVQHLVVEGSLDATMAKRICAKQNTIDAALDSVKGPSLEVLVDVPDKKNRGGATVDTNRAQLEAEAAKMTADQRKAVHEALKFLSDRDSDGARYQNDKGFSGLDTRIGNDLASRPYLSPKQAALGRKIVRKYAKTQLPENLAVRL